MIARCENPNHPVYKYYGGRGIKVCARWHILDNFLKDVGERPSSAHSIDRWPNNDGDYGPDNFRWATRQQQQRNRRNAAMEIAAQIGITVNGYLKRKRDGSSGNDLLRPRFKRRVNL